MADPTQGQGQQPPPVGGPQGSQQQAGASQAAATVMPLGEKLSAPALWGMGLGVLVGAAAAYKKDDVNVFQMLIGAAIGAITGASAGVLVGDVIVTTRG